MPRRIESHFIAGPAGRLEALLEEERGGDAGPLLEKVLLIDPGHMGARRRLAREGAP